MNNRFKREKFVVLAEYLEQQTDYRRYKRKIRKSRRGPSWRRNQPYIIYLSLSNKWKPCHRVGHVISEQHWKSTFYFTEIVHNYQLKQGTVCQIVRFTFHFSLELYIQY